MEKSIRGGISQISKRYAKANNDKCRDFDLLKPISHLIYLDCNNLYAVSMKSLLPTHGFRWLTNDEIKNINIHDLLDDAEDGFIFEVDLHYPKRLHNTHNDYPLAAESLIINESMLSSFQLKFPKNQKNPSQKLTPNLNDKTKYVVHYRNLKFYIAEGLEIKKIHRVLSSKVRGLKATLIQIPTCEQTQVQILRKTFIN